MIAARLGTSSEQPLRFASSGVLQFFPDGVVIESIWRSDAPVRLDPSARAAVETSAAVIHKAAGGHVPVYGVNTGFGLLSRQRISPDELELLQREVEAVLR